MKIRIDFFLLYCLSQKKDDLNFWLCLFLENQESIKMADFVGRFVVESKENYDGFMKGVGRFIHFVSTFPNLRVF